MITPKIMRFYGLKDIDTIPELSILSEDQKFQIKVVANVLPFRVNNYVVEELIDWDNIPDDPIFQLTTTQPGMLSDLHFRKMADVLVHNPDPNKVKEAASEIRLELNPHPAGQMTLNIPKLDENHVPGIQHKYRETVLIFPSSGQTCHAYCTFCFRWPQFVGMNELKFATDESKKFQEYIKSNLEISDVLLTGGDPMVMNSKNLAEYIEPLLEPEFEHIQNIRIGTKSISYWPYKYVTDNDADDILRLFEKVSQSGKHLAIMAHFNHWKELETEISQEAIKRIKLTGAEIRTQSPVVKHVNDDADVWARMWKEQVKLGCIPYYFFIERNTGAEEYFAIPLADAFEIFVNAYGKVSGLSRTARGPSMSALPGKIRIDGISEIKGEKVFVLTMLQARNPKWIRKPFFAKFSPTARWYTDLKPAFGDKEFFFQEELNRMISASHGQMFFDSAVGSEVIESSMDEED